MNSQWIELVTSKGETFQGYLSLPPTGSGPGIVLIQEIFGVNAHIQAVADQYAMDGYVVLAPDLFWRQERRVNLGYDGEDFNKGLDLMARIDLEDTLSDLAVSAGSLRQRSEVTGRISSLGYCMGGKLSYLAATQGIVDAAICYYGAGIDGLLERAKTIHCPILFHFAEQDAYISSQAISAVKEAFVQKADAWIQTYPGVNHGFNCWARGAYNQPAAALARGRSLEFLSYYLTPVANPKA